MAGSVKLHEQARCWCPILALPEALDTSSLYSCSMVLYWGQSTSVFEQCKVVERIRGLAVNATSDYEPEFSICSSK